MTQTLLPPDIRAEIDALKAEVRRLQTAVRARPSDGTVFEAVFSHPGEIVVSESPGLALEEGGAVANLVVLAKSVGAGDSVFVVQKNGVSLGGITLPAADLIGRVSFAPVQFSPDLDVVSVACTQAGGHEDVTVQVRFR